MLKQKGNHLPVEVPPLLRRKLGDVFAKETHLPFRRGFKSREQMHQGALPASARPEDGEEPCFGKREIHVTEQKPLPLVSNPQIPRFQQIIHEMPSYYIWEIEGKIGEFPFRGKKKRRIHRKNFFQISRNEISALQQLAT